MDLFGMRTGEGFDSEASGALLAMPTRQRTIGEKEVARAIELLTHYKNGKSNLENQIVENERWYQLRHWDCIRKKAEGGPEPASAWLFNAVMNKHADAMDNYPEPNVLPRERSDEGSAKTLASVLPVVLERCGFEDVYDANWWEKLKHGCGVYGIFWNPTLENGLGDIDIRQIDLLNIFWEPGITDIQKSRNLFTVELVDNDLLEEAYPELKGKLGGQVVDVKQYVYDDTVSTQDKSVVVDWYYKKKAANGRTLLHYAKFCGSTLLFASENDPAYTERGWYDHGLYPFEFDVLFPEKGTPCGFGLISVAKDPQLYIDKLSANILENSMMKTKPRWFVSSSAGINREQLLDWNEPLIEVEGSLEDNRIRQVEVGGVDGIALNILQMKIDELKETSANRDVSSGGSTSGATAAAAIAALQEAGNKSSRDMIAASYRRYKGICYLCIELMRQFYDVTRSFRITGESGGDYQFADFSNEEIADQPMGTDSQGIDLFRKPVFDITIKAQKKNPFSRASQNELAKELYGAGFFNPERAQEVLGALEMMEFEGKDKVQSYVQQGQTLMQMVQQLSALLQQISAGGLGTPSGRPAAASPVKGDAGDGDRQGGGPAAPGRGTVQAGAVQAERTASTPYMDRLAANSRPNPQSTGRVMPG